MTQPQVKCDVKSCKYNEQEKYCTAEGILVSTSSTNTCSCGETLCSTFDTRE